MCSGIAFLRGNNRWFSEKITVLAKNSVILGHFSGDVKNAEKEKEMDGKYVQYSYLTYWKSVL